MLRTHILRPRWLTVVLVLWAVAWLAVPAPGEGAPLPPSRSSAEDGVTRGAVEPAALREALVTRGLAPAEADQVLARLSPAEQAELAQRINELEVGGDPSLVLIVVIILIVAILLYIPMAGKMQGWWR
jgi:hypothetical protein